MPVELRRHDLLGAPETRRFLSDYVRRRVNERDVEDVVQTILVDALAASKLPEDKSEFRKWLTGVARHKIADLHRKNGREQPSELPEIETAPPPIEERLMAEWAEKEAGQSPGAVRTLEWMARESEGEKLEQIAEDENVAPTAVRQRVSRLRRFMKERYLAELAAVAALVIAAIIAARAFRHGTVDVTPDDPPIADKRAPVIPTPRDEAIELRRGALEACKRDAFDECLRGLDRARELDPIGDSSKEVQDARKRANDAPTKQNDSKQNDIYPESTSSSEKTKPFDDAPKQFKGPPLKSVPKPTTPSFDEKGSSKPSKSSLDSDSNATPRAQPTSTEAVLSPELQGKSAPSYAKKGGTGKK